MGLKTSNDNTTEHSTGLQKASIAALQAEWANKLKK